LVKIDAKAIFWDFDGVIKDSVGLKSDAFSELFSSSDKTVVNKINEHHELNGGVSRYEKIPLYLEWSGKDCSEERVRKYEKKFSKLVKLKVIQSDWIPGVENYLRKHFNDHEFFLITATPQNEIEEILEALHIKHLFKKIVGSPIKKEIAINEILKERKILAKDSVMIGDSEHDYIAAKFNKVPFILRKTMLNRHVQRRLNCVMIDNFYE